ncbi:hypothetical protein EJD97_023966 [Solanum chilense]|uniref:Uncharacterized protein n=1 Tax=Solanum chilense TaxID=4083 RepID=A0A6N2ARS2_SOLCI|nr:hypothetical protein EJD97_023966 [Solanum chilense]
MENCLDIVTFHLVVQVLRHQRVRWGIDLQIWIFFSKDKITLDNFLMSMELHWLVWTLIPLKVRMTHSSSFQFFLG